MKPAFLALYRPERNIKKRTEGGKCVFILLYLHGYWLCVAAVKTIIR